MSDPTATSTAELRSDPRVAEARVAVLSGGRSSEREVSLVSGRALVQALTAPARDRRGPASVAAIEIEADGRWRVGDALLAPPAALAALDDVDVFVLGLHGGEGEGGVLQGLLRASEKAFTGADVDASALCLDKTNARIVAAAHGLRTARALAVTPEGWRELREAVVDALGAWPPGWVVKRRRGGSSLGVRIVRDPAEIPSAVEDGVREGDDVLVEELVRGVEATVAVLGNPEEGLRAFPPVEIRPKEGRFFDYEEKYAESGAVELCPPESLDAAACDVLRQRALTAYRGLGCSGYARIDFLVPPDGEPVFLEANTLPGFTPRSLFPQAARADGVDFRSLCLELVRLALSARRTPLS